MRLGICCFFIICMGILSSKLNANKMSLPDTQINTPDPNTVLTPQEKEHLVLLGTTAGSPSIMMDAIKSGNIFDPMHMERAQGFNKQWEDAAALFAPYFEKQRRIEAEREQLRQMGMRMGGKPRSSTYAHIEAQIGDLGLPTADWFLRIESTAGEHVDLKLSAHSDVIADCLIDACHAVPEFDAVLHRPDMEPVMIFSHREVVG